jgi:hypothetical protein
MKTISKKALGISSAHSVNTGKDLYNPIPLNLCKAELLGCLLGACGSEVMEEILYYQIPDNATRCSTYAQGQALAYLAVYATVYSGVFGLQSSRYLLPVTLS